MLSRSKETVSRQQSRFEACLKAFQHIFMAHKTRSIYVVKTGALLK